MAKNNILAGGRKVVVYQFTRPANVTAYAAGAVINNDDNAGEVGVFKDVARMFGAGYSLSYIQCVLSDAGSPNPQLRLELFHTAPAAQNDGDAYSPTTAERANCIAAIDFDFLNGGDTVNGSIRCPGTWEGDGIPGGAFPEEKDCYCVLRNMSNTWTPGTAAIITITAIFDRD